MPTVLAVNNYYYLRGGSEAVFFHQNRALQGLGWTVVPFAMKHPCNFETEWSNYFIERNEFDGSQSFMAKIAHVPGVIYSLEARRKLAELLSVVVPDVCHAHNIYHHISPAILGLLKKRGIPTVLTVHDLKIACPAYTMLTHDGVCERCRGGRLYNVVRHRCIKQSVVLSSVVMFEAVLHRLLGSYSGCVDRFIVPSAFHINKFIEWGMAPDLFRHLPNCVEADSFEPQFLPGKEITFVGRVSPEKGLATLVRAARQAGCSLRVVGDGPALGSVRALASECGVNTCFTGHLTGEPLRSAIKAARAIVVPSECYENAPMSILEAYALGKPVIGARIGGIPELVREGESGWLFESGDPHSLARVLRSVVDSREPDLEEMGRFARRWVEAEFSPQLHRDRLLKVYREVGVNGVELL